MNYKKSVKNNKLLIATVIIYLTALIYNPNYFLEGLDTSWMYVKEMLEVLPAVFILTGLLEVWVPKETILKIFGSGAGIKGKLASITIGSVSAGPIYAAFPVCQSLLRKGASISNVVIILSAWAVVKAPMLIVESKFLGLPFMMSRYVLTIPGIILIGLITDYMVNREDVMEKAKRSVNKLTENIYDLLPGYNCGSCGYKSCKKCAEAIAGDGEEYDVCKPIDEESQKKIRSVIENAS
jgi:uncharacterized membrane protein YraQ (UPF0718 family)